MKSVVVKNLIFVLALTSSSFARAEGQDEYVTHQVHSGETLQTISQKYYNTTRRWFEIFKLNHDVLQSSDKVEPGITLKLRALRQAQHNKKVLKKFTATVEKPQTPVVQTQVLSHEPVAMPVAKKDTYDATDDHEGVMDQIVPTPAIPVQTSETTLDDLKVTRKPARAMIHRQPKEKPIALESSVITESMAAPVAPAQIDPVPQEAPQVVEKKKTLHFDEFLEP